MDFHWTSTVLGLIEAIIVRVQTDQSTGGRLLRVGSRSAEGKAHSGAEAAHLHTSDPSQARTMRIHVHTRHGLHSMDTTSISAYRFGKCAPCVTASAEGVRWAAEGIRSSAGGGAADVDPLIGEGGVPLLADGVCVMYSLSQ